jgi:hypothetical protein
MLLEVKCMAWAILYRSEVKKKGRGKRNKRRGREDMFQEKCKVPSV